MLFMRSIDSQSPINLLVFTTLLRKDFLVTILLSLIAPQRDVSLTNSTILLLGHDGRGVYSFPLDRMKVFTLGSSLVLHVDGVTR
jgi:hypothetical protein